MTYIFSANWIIICEMGKNADEVSSYIICPESRMVDIQRVEILPMTDTVRNDMPFCATISYCYDTYHNMTDVFKNACKGKSFCKSSLSNLNNFQRKVCHQGHYNLLKVSYICQ